MLSCRCLVECWSVTSVPRRLTALPRRQPTCLTCGWRSRQASATPPLPSPLAIDRGIIHHEHVQACPLWCARLSRAVPSIYETTETSVCPSCILISTAWEPFVPKAPWSFRRPRARCLVCVCPYSTGDCMLDLRQAGPEPEIRYDDGFRRARAGRLLGEPPSPLL